MFVELNRVTQGQTRAEQIKPARQSGCVLILGC
jgi:hypothetical protein